jgi:predicted Zn-dependent protease
MEFSAQLSAVAAAEGAARNAKYKLGVLVFTLARGGLMYEASVGGQKFSYRPTRIEHALEAKNGTWRVCMAAALLLAAGVGCTTVSETGRRQFIVISPQQEMQLGATAFTQMKAEVPISEDAKAQAMVERVGQRIAAVAPLPGAEWEFVLFESPQVNAFCLPEARLGYTAAFWPSPRRRPDLATVIGHEVAHAVARHGAERMSEAVAMQVGGTALDIGLQQVDSDPRWQSAAVGW